MSTPTPPTPSKALSVFLGIFAAFGSFAVIAFFFQGVFGGRPEVRNHEERVMLKAEIEKEQKEVLDKFGLSGDPLPVYKKALSQIAGREVKATLVVVPGSPTALKAAAPPTPAPASEAPAPEAAPPAPASEQPPPAAP